LRRCTYPLCLHRPEGTGPCPQGHKGQCDDMAPLRTVGLAIVAWACLLLVLAVALLAKGC
jgi:hypothetical protein